jgi:uroporphyrinogen decarboxylase
LRAAAALRYTQGEEARMTVPDLLPPGHRPDYRRLEKVLTRSAIPDRVPFYELFIEDTMVERMTGERLSPAAEVGLYFRLGHDYCNFSPEMGLHQTDCLEADDTGENNAAGRREWLDGDHGVVMSRRDFDRYPWPTVGDWCCERFTEYARHLRDGMKLVIRPTGVFENVRRLVGMVPLSLMLYDDPQLAADIFDRVGSIIHGVVEHTFRRVDLRMVFACIMGDDLSHGGGPLVPPEVYRRHVFPWMKRVADLAHSHGMPFGLHSCGNNTAIMEELINDVGIDAKHSFQDGVESVVDFKRRYGDRLAVLGGIDMGRLATMPAAEFRPWCRGVLAACMQGGGFALGTGNSPATYVRLENFYAMHEEGFAHGRYGGAA